MITTFIIAVVTLASALGLTGLAGLCVDNVDRRWQRRGQAAYRDPERAHEATGTGPAC
jgi:hypothetical protein